MLYAPPPERQANTKHEMTELEATKLALQRERAIRSLISEFAADFMASSSADFNAAINRVLARSGKYMKADRTYVFLMTPDGQRMNNTHEWCAPGIEPEMHNLQGVPSSATPWWWSQFREVGYVLVPRVCDMPPEAKNEYHILESQGIRSVCVYPLHIGKKLVGFMGNDAVGTERHWGEDVLEFLSLLSNLLGIALGHIQLHQKRDETIRHLKRAEKQAQVGHWHIDYESNEVMWSQEMMRIFGCDPNSFKPTLKSFFEFIHPEDKASALSTFETAKAALHNLYIEHRLLINGTTVKHIESRGRFNTNSDGSLLSAEGTVQNVTEKVQQRESLQRLAFEDSLTGLPNRRSIENTLAQEMLYCDRCNMRLALALLDIDNFRELNEQHGAALGDALLKALALRIRRFFNNTATVARVGGDEFVVLFTRLQANDSYFSELNRLLAAINKPLSIDGIDIILTVSIGVTEYPQPMEVAGEQLLRQTQQALFQVKMSGKGHFLKYDIGSEQEARELTDFIEQIRTALYSDELVLYYQPKVFMNTGAVFGAEALVRWQKNNGELVLPGKFLPALLNHPLEIELGDWVIRTALEQMQIWKRQGLDIQVSVNVSSQQLFDKDFVHKLSCALKLYPDIEPAALQLEVLESSMLNDLETVSSIMHLTRQLGVSFALDDFGTGYSSLAYLKYLPASVLKIDQSFIREMLQSTDDLSIISGVIGMANAFGMQVIAEGVETIAQGNLLLKLGCEQGQGYGIARPMPADDFPRWAQHWQAPPSWLGQPPVEAHNLPLLYAEVEHRSWIIALEQWLCGELKNPPVLDRHHCKLGVWIDSEANSRFGLQAKFSNLEKLHHDIHQLGQSAISLYTQDQAEAAKKLLPQLWHLRDLFMDELKSLIG